MHDPVTVLFVWVVVTKIRSAVVPVEVVSRFIYGLPTEMWVDERDVGWVQENFLMIPQRGVEPGPWQVPFWKCPCYHQWQLGWTHCSGVCVSESADLFSSPHTLWSLWTHICSKSNYVPMYTPELVYLLDLNAFSASMSWLGYHRKYLIWCHSFGEGEAMAK